MSKNLYSQPIRKYDDSVAFLDKILKYKMITTIQQTVIPIERVYGVYNDKDNPIVLISLPNHNNYIIGYEITAIDDEKKIIILKYIDKKFKFVFLPTEKDFVRVEHLLSGVDGISKGNNKFHDIRNEKVYSAGSLRAFYVDKSEVWMDKGLSLSRYNIFCSIKIGQDEKIFMINKVFLGKNRRDAFYLVDELDAQDMMIMKYNLLRVYPSSKLGIHKHHNQIVLDASAVFINEYFIDNYGFNSAWTAFNNMKQEYLDEVHNVLDCDKQQSLEFETKDE